jgi:thiamine kinase-like enzyme
MEKITSRNISSIIEKFDIPGKYVDFRPQSTGHINETYIVTFERDNTRTRYILQRINKDIFKNPVQLMENMQRVTEHIHQKLLEEKAPDFARKSLTLLLTKDGSNVYQDEENQYWRVCRYIENTQCYESIEMPEQVYEAAKTFGEFQTRLIDFPPPRLHEIIPDFHNTPKRFQAFEEVLQRDSHNRAKEVRGDIDYALRNESMVYALSDLQKKNQLPERITHNDAKINNILLDENASQGLCVIDLDTVMPGLSLYDFGDMFRTTICKAKEDEPDISKIQIELPFFKALVQGYLSGTQKFLTPLEKSLLVTAGKLITFEQGIRFLMDYLNGDTYYRIHRKNQNLERARAQFRLVQLASEQEDPLDRIISDHVE